MDADKLIEDMARAIWERQCQHWGRYREMNPALCVWEELTQSKQRELIREATAAYTAMRDELVPVGWMYEYTRRHPGQTRPGAMEITRDRTAHPLAKGWTETPLYALPEIKP